MTTKGDLGKFDDDEISIIDGVADWLDGMTARQVSDLFHDEPAWFLAGDHETLALEMAYLRVPVWHPEIAARGRALLARRER